MIRPDSSATGMNSAGSIARPPGCRQRSSASWANSTQPLSDTTGWKTSSSSRALERALEVVLGLHAIGRPPAQPLVEDLHARRCRAALAR